VGVVLVALVLEDFDAVVAHETHLRVRGDEAYALT
jgi:hypothetical protein